MNRTHTAALALVLTLAPLAGCGDSGDQLASVVTVRDSAGVRIVEQSTIVVSRVDLGEPYLELGSIDGEEEAFFRVTDIDRLADGAWVVANSGTTEARIFGENGTFLRSFVGEGDGPGELGSLSGLVVMEGDSVFAWDLFGRRGAVFTADGDLGRTVRAGDELGRFYAEPVGTVGGSIVMKGASIFSDDRGEGSRMIRPMIRDRRFPFAKEGQITVAGDRIVTGDSGSDELRVVDADGRLAAIWRVLGDPAEVTAEDWSTERARLLDGMETDAGRRAVRTMFDEMERPSRRPAWSELLGAADGSLWVRQFTTEGESERAEWWVVSPEGEVVLEVTGPADVQLLWSDGDIVAGKYVDELDIEYLRFYRIGE